MPEETTTIAEQDVVGTPQEAVDTTTPITADPAKEVGVISSQQGADIVKKAQEVEAGITNLASDEIDKDIGANIVKKAEQLQSEIDQGIEDQITFINPETDQQQVLKGEAISPDAVQQIEDKGFVQSESTLTQPIETNPEVQRAQRELKNAQKQTNSFLKGLESSLVSDRELRGELSSIAKLYDQRIDQAQDITDRGVAATRTLGIRTGSRFTGGTGGIIGGIISERELQGLRTMTALEAEKQVALSNAKRAAKQQNYTVYTKLINEAQSIQDKKVDALSELKEAQIEQQDLINEQARLAEVQGAIVDQIDLGFSSPTDIFSALEGQVSFDDILAITKHLPEQPSAEDFTLGKSQIRFDSQGNVVARGSGVGGGGLPGVSAGSGASVGAGVTTGDFPTDQDLENMAVDERDFVNKVIRNLPTKLKDSEQEKRERMKEALFDFRRGRSFQDVADEMKGFVVQGEGQQVLGSIFRTFAAGTDIELSDIAAALNRGDRAKAMTIIENGNLDKVDGFFSGTQDARNVVSQSSKVLSIMDGMSEETLNKLGAFDGQVFKAKRFAGLTSTEELQLQRLNTAMDLLNAPLRVAIAGTAVTPTEEKKIEGFQSSIQDQPDIARTKIEELQESILGFHNQSRDQRGLPTVDSSQLIDSEKRLKLYEDLAEQKTAQQFSIVPNADLFVGMTDKPSTEVDEFAGNNEDFFSNFNKR